MAGLIQVDAFQHLGTIRQVKFGIPLGLYCFPTSDDSPTGWGQPFIDANGSLINPPLGTPGGNAPYNLLVRDAQDQVTLSRGRNLPYSTESFDWRGLESEAGAGDMPFLHFAGPRSRYFPQMDYTGFSPSEDTSSLYSDKFYDGTREIEGPGETIRGGCIFDQGGADPYYVVVTGSDIQSATGITFWKRLVSGGEWVEIDTVDDERSGVRFTGITWDVPWHFNAAGNKACQIKAARHPEPNPTDVYDAGVRYVISFDLSTVTIDVALNDGVNRTTTIVREAGPEPPTYDNVQRVTSSSTGSDSALAVDFKYPDDTLEVFRGISGIASGNLGESTEKNTVEGVPPDQTLTSVFREIRSNTTERKFFLGSNTWTLMQTSISESRIQTSVLLWPFTGTATTDVDYNIDERLDSDQDDWNLAVIGADLRYGVVALMIPQLTWNQIFAQYELSPALLALTGSTAPGVDFTPIFTPTDSGYATNKARMEVAILSPAGVETFTFDQSFNAIWDFVAVSGIPGVPNGTYPIAQGSGVETSIFVDVPETVVIVTPPGDSWMSTTRGPRQSQSLVASGLAVDRFGNIFYSFQLNESTPGKFNVFQRPIIPGGGFEANDSMDPETRYEYENADIDALSQITGDNKRYHPLQAT